MSNHRDSGLANPIYSRIFGRLSDKRSVFLAFLRKRVESLEIAEDLLHATYVRAIEHLASLRDEQRAEAWFYRLLRNATIDHYRRTASVAKVVVQEAAIDRPVDSAGRANTCPCATRELTRLKTSYARALKDVEMDGTSVHVFASNERIAPGTASVRLHRARKALAARLRTICGSCSGQGCFDCSCAESAP